MSKKRIIVSLVAVLIATAGFAQNETAVPNPYTTFDIPTSAGKVPVGLPKNDTGDKPALTKSKETVSYCAYIYREGQFPGKIFYNADRRRIYEVTFGYMESPRSKVVRRTLSVVDSLLIYQIDDETKTITRINAQDIAKTAKIGVTSNVEVIHEKDIARSSGRWCYALTSATESTRAFAGNTASETVGGTIYRDLETGIVLEETHGYGHDYTRNIHVGLFYPEIFDLPKGYRIVESNLNPGKAAEKIKEREKGIEEMMKKAEGMKNMSLEDLKKFVK